MLTGLEDVDWGKLSDAYGPATEVPTYLRELESEEEAVRDRAMWKLWGSVWHQGTIFSVTPAVAPFLIDAAIDPGPKRLELLLLIGSIASSAAGDAEVEDGVDADTIAVLRRNIPPLGGIASGCDDSATLALEFLFLSAVGTVPESVASHVAARFEMADDPFVRGALAYGLWAVDGREELPEMARASVSSVDHDPELLQEAMDPTASVATRAQLLVELVRRLETR